jgi:excisionase family DNA binding protein
MPATHAFDVENAAVPTAEDMQAARETVRLLAPFGNTRKVKLCVDGIDPIESIALPSSIFAQVINLLAKLGNGDAVTIVPVQAEVTTTQAAELLGVSRPFLIKLLERGEIPFHMVGTHRKLKARDVTQYKMKRMMTRRAALNNMAELDAELGIDADIPVGAFKTR